MLKCSATNCTNPAVYMEAYCYHDGSPMFLDPYCSEHVCGPKAYLSDDRPSIRQPIRPEDLKAWEHVIDNRVGYDPDDLLEKFVKYKNAHDGTNIGYISAFNYAWGEYEAGWPEDDE